MMVVTSKVNISPVPEEKPTLVSEEPQTYASKTVSFDTFIPMWTADKMYSVCLYS